MTPANDRALALVAKERKQRKEGVQRERQERQKDWERQWESVTNAGSSIHHDIMITMMRMLLRNYVSFRRQIVVRAPASDLMTTLLSFLIKSAHGSVFADACTHVLPDYLSEDGEERQRERVQR